MEEKRTYTAADTAPGATAPRCSTTEAFGSGRFGSESENGHHAPAESFKNAAAHFAELKEYAGLFVAAKLDALKLTLRNVVLYAVLGLLGAIVGVALIVTAAVYLLSGLAGAIGEIFPQPYEWWAGRLIVGALVLGVTFGGVLFLMKSLTGSSRKRTIEKYENRKRDERDAFGHDVRDRAREQQAQSQRQ
jgi:hypothetical protein